ncbi:hypothetical protein B0T19DRAFT_353718 [Cercophora scortea]|uniref:F-box domain-containing protein n=1 Tax=Cercophora scortea TaxID=314031 RepID=A0AAE0IWT1_9PEZI|nr:hypothetical protein B0T19DRAFT_353718 [Cercophora scortea]
MSTADDGPKPTAEASSGRTIQNLAPEIIDNIIHQVPEPGDLKSIRLVSKDLDAHARRKLFREVFLKPIDATISRWNSTADQPALSQVPRLAVIHTRENVEDEQDRSEYPRPGEAFRAALAALSKFPKVDSLELTFTPECHGPESFLDVPEDHWQRLEILEWVFQAIKDRMDVPGTSKIRSLTLRNLQNFPYDGFPDSELFSSVMQQLEELHVGLIQEYNEHGPDGDYDEDELLTFPPHFCSKWLQPIAPNLKALSVYSKVDNWGCFPGYFDPSAIVFPKLETLSLGYYTIAHDDDLDWLLNNCKSLTTLVMHNCMIARCMLFDDSNIESWKVSTRDWQVVRRSDEYAHAEYMYNGRWSAFFDKIATALPNLREFRFDYITTWDRETKNVYDVNNRQLGAAKAYAARYVAFNDGILPNRWPEAEVDGTIDDWYNCITDEAVGLPNFHMEALEEDQKSLDRLLELCRARREAAGLGHSSAN